MKGRQLLWWIPILLVALLIVPVIRGLWFYRSLPLARSVVTPDLGGITVATPAPGTFTDEPLVGHGLVLFDRAHANLFSPPEVGVLTSRLIARGMAVHDLTYQDDLEEALRSAAALVVITPGEEYTSDEIDTIHRFVAKGGRLLLVGDPTRFALIEDEYGYYAIVNSARFLTPLVEPFGLAFEEDYLYNVVENEGNYQNILLRTFGEGALTAGLSQVAFYSTHSIRSRDGGLILADGETRSSTDDLGRQLAVAALDGEGQVLALGDLTFMTNPYAGVLDNDRLVSNIADFLAAAERRYEMDDFPYYFGDEIVLVPLGLSELGTAQVLAGSRLQQTLQAAKKHVVLRDEEDPDRDALFVGLYEKTGAVSQYLEAAGISIQAEDTVSITLDISGMGEMDGTGLALLYRQQVGDRHILILLADDEDNLDLALESLSGGDLSGCLTANDELALCVVGEGGDGGWDDGGGDGNGGGDGDGGGNSILIVSDDDLSEESDCFSAAFYYDLILYEDYMVETWYEYIDGHPTLADLQAYDAVIWSGGTCSGLVPDEEDAETLRQYVAGGGRLLIEGINIGQDWSGTAFYDEVCHAEASGTALLVDLEVADGEHALAKGFEKGQVIDLLEGVSEFSPDVVAATGEARPVFVRGPASEEAGMHAIIAYQGNGARVVYVAFPLYFLPDEEAEILIQNAAAWLLGK